MSADAEQRYNQIINNLASGKRPEKHWPIPPWDDVFFQYLIVKRLQEVGNAKQRLPRV